MLHRNTNRKPRFEITRENGQYRVTEIATGRTVVPECGQDMADMYAYLVGNKGNIDFAESILEDIVNGKKPITELKMRASTFPRPMNI